VVAQDQRGVVALGPGHAVSARGGVQLGRVGQQAPLEVAAGELAGGGVEAEEAEPGAFFFEADEDLAGQQAGGGAGRTAQGAAAGPGGVGGEGLLDEAAPLVGGPAPELGPDVGVGAVLFAAAQEGLGGDRGRRPHQIVVAGDGEQGRGPVGAQRRQQLAKQGADGVELSGLAALAEVAGEEHQIEGSAHLAAELHQILPQGRLDRRQQGGHPGEAGVEVGEVEPTEDRHGAPRSWVQPT